MTESDLCMSARHEETLHGKAKKYLLLTPGRTEEKPPPTSG